MERLSPYLEFIREKFDERCFFVTEHGRMGIGPDGLKAGTLVCVVKGSLQTQEFERVEIE
ncbi:ankyrin and HET domain-containing protein [Colletotrichum tofieldiae]|nr:ankyrin and HET domain-containing protein [Colletotrichum tofieldiae]